MYVYVHVQMYILHKKYIYIHIYQKNVYAYAYTFKHVYIYIYMFARPPAPMIHTFGLGKGVLGGGGGTPDSRFPEKIWSTRAPDSRIQISRKNLEYP